MTAKDSERPRRWAALWGSRPALVVAAAAVALIFGAGAFLAWDRASGSEDAGQQTPAHHEPLDSDGSPVPSPEPPQDGGQSHCGLASADDISLEELPEDTDWGTNLGASAVPSSPTHGPGVVHDNGLRECFAYSPQGAALAAINYLALVNDPVTAPAAMEALLLEGPGKEQLLTVASEQEGSPVSVRMEFVGVRLIAYGADRARIDVAASMDEIGDQEYASVPVDLVWEDGDWRVQTREDGQMMIPPSSITSMEYHVPLDQGEAP